MYKNIGRKVRKILDELFYFEAEQCIPDLPSLMSCPDSIEPFDWVSGKIMEAPKSPVKLEMCKTSGNSRGCVITGLLTLFHEVFIGWLTELGIDNIQYFPVELRNPEGETEYAYSLINIIGIFEAVDTEASDIMPPSGACERGELGSFKIDPDKVKGQRIFRIAEEPALIIIDETLSDELMAFNPPAIRILPTEMYDGFY